MSAFAGMGSVMNKLFGGAATTPNGAPPTQPQIMNPNAPTGNPNPGAPLAGTVGNNVTAPNGVIPTPNAPQTPAPGSENNEPPSPLDAFKDIWSTPTTPDPNVIAPVFSALDPKKVLESARQVDFSKAITPELLAKINAGGADAMTAMVTAMNSVAQTVYAQNAVATSKIVEQALGKYSESSNAALPSLVKKFSANESVLQENPLFTNPALQPLVGALQEQFIRKNPTATATEIKAQVTDYFNAIGMTFAPKPIETPEQKLRKINETDWSSFEQ